MKIGQIVNKMPVQRLSRGSPLLVDCESLLGIEVEVENATLYNPESDSRSNYWSHKEDHSLRNNGREFIFMEPLYGADAVSAVEFIVEKAESLKWKISERTGLHVHLDVRNLELNNFRAFCVAYSLMEPLIYNWVGDKRHENMFCLPWYAADYDLENFSNILPRADKDAASARNVIQGIRKYSGLNLAALVTFGTVEFRHLKTTFDKQRILDWLNIILSLKIFAQYHTKPVLDIVKYGRVYGPRALAMKIFGQGLTDSMWYDGFVQDYVGKGMVTADMFMESDMERYLLSNPDTTIYDYVLSRQLSKPKEEKETDHPGIAKFKSKQAKEKPKKKAVTKQQMYIGDWVTGLGANTPQPPPGALLIEPEPQGFDIGILEEGENS